MRNGGTSLGDVPDEQTPPSHSASTVTGSRARSAAPTAVGVESAYQRLDKTILGRLRSREKQRARQLLEDGVSVEDARAVLVSERKARRARARDELASVGEGRGGA